MSTGAWALVVAVVGALGLGLALRAREGRVRMRTKRHDVEDTVFNQLPEQLHRRLADDPDGSRVTLLQLSTTFCAPCRHTRILLANFAERTDGVRHVEIDLTDHPEWSTPLRVHTTPTTLALDSAGHELFRIGGVPRRDALTEALQPHLS